MSIKKVLFTKEKIMKDDEMVCIPCIIAPVLLFIWYRFIQPIVLKFWNPWDKAVKNPTSTTESKGDEKSSCPFSSKVESEPLQSTEAVDTGPSNKKCD